MSTPIAEGQILDGKYRVERVLGKGGMGIVFAAVHEQLQQRVAIKFLLPGANDEWIQRFLREARASARLKSEHVARVLDVAELDDGTPYMVMEYLDGVDLSQRLRRGGRLSVEDAVTHVLHACEALAEAHAAGIIHRDLKPANLFLTTAADGSETVKVLDFGISKTALSAAGGDPADPQAELSLTGTEVVLGSPLFMSPQQMTSSRSVDAQADIWSLGVILYQLLTARLPFEAGSYAELIMMVNGQEPTSPRAFREDLPEALEAAILRCLRKDLSERIANVGELAQAIAPFAPVDGAASLRRILRTLSLAPSRNPVPRANSSGAWPSSAAIRTPSPSAPPSAAIESNNATPSPEVPEISAAASAGRAAAPASGAVDPSPAARSRAAGKVVAALMGLFTLGAVAFAGSWLRARSDQASPPTAELAPMRPVASSPVITAALETAVSPKEPPPQVPVAATTTTAAAAASASSTAGPPPSAAATSPRLPVTMARRPIPSAAVPAASSSPDTTTPKNPLMNMKLN